ncbi:MAG TPA: YciI family protein [Methylomirabilota bacterium]|nr:YciI family protein [Methylomirabilota bacterium]
MPAETVRVRGSDRNHEEAQRCDAWSLSKPTKIIIMLAGEGLHPSSKGKRVRFSGAKRTVLDGPFAETKELIAGFWLWRVKSMDEAIEWVKRCPNPMPGTEPEVEIRQIFEAEDLGAGFTPELREQEVRQRTQADGLRNRKA